MIIAVIDATFAVAKRKPEKKIIRIPTGSRSLNCFVECNPL